MLLTKVNLETDNRNYEYVLLDIETLNKHAQKGEYEVSAVSIHSYSLISNKYRFMNCDASMGEGYGLMLISKELMSVEEAKNKKIAIPGLGTSAYLALRLAWGRSRC